MRKHKDHRNFSHRLFIVMVIAALGLVGCNDDGSLRGSVKTSADGKTYLIVADDNGGQCGPIYVDGKIWPHKIGEPGRVAAGVHTIACGGEISFEIPAGVIFSFDYWGP